MMMYSVDPRGSSAELARTFRVQLNLDWWFDPFGFKRAFSSTNIRVVADRDHVPSRPKRWSRRSTRIRSKCESVVNPQSKLPVY